jgi:predicted RNase H-like nuclease (RuvC/YqgF family)
VAVEDQVKLNMDQLDKELLDAADPVSGAAAAALLPLASSLPAHVAAALDATKLLDSVVGATGSSAVASIKDDWDREKAALYSQLDEKDDEINAQSQELEKCSAQMNEQEELISALRRESDDLQQRIQSLEADNESQKDEVKEVLKALEELAMNFDQKQQEAELKSRENETLTLELDKKLSNLKVFIFH